MATGEVGTVFLLSKPQIGVANEENRSSSELEMQQLSRAPNTMTDAKVGAAFRPSKPHIRVTKSEVQQNIEAEAQQLSGSSSSSTFCRICHDGASHEELISLCKCCGTVGLLHLSCVERWLSATNTNCCEICGCQFITERRNQHFKQWLKNPTKPSDKRNLIADIMCFLLLTPLAAISAWLCISGAIYYSKASILPGWETNGLLILSLLLIAIYAVWCLIAVRYHMRVFRDWQKINQVVRVIVPSPRDSRLAIFGKPSLFALLSNHLHAADGAEPRAIISSPFLSATGDKQAVCRPSEIHPLYTVSATDGKWTFGRLPATSLSDTVICSCCVSTCADESRVDFKI